MTTNTAGVVSEEMVERMAKWMCRREIPFSSSLDEVLRRMGNWTRYKPEARDALEATLGVSGWRPIAEAPRDGTYVLITDRRHPPCHLIARWNHGKWWGQPTQTGRAITWDEATDFMPLPPPPATEDSA